jgi:hypothetical protein
MRGSVGFAPGLRGFSCLRFKLLWRLMRGESGAMGFLVAEGMLTGLSIKTQS